MRCPCTDPRGFTLVETLVASVILFTCLAAALIAYNSGLNSTAKMEARLAMLEAVPHIRWEVRNSLQVGRTKGQNPSGEGLDYRWEARLITSSRTVRRAYDDLLGGPDHGAFTLELYRVELVVTSRFAGRETVGDYDYLELVWKR